MTMQSSSDCPQMKLNKKGDEERPCGRPRLFYVQEERNDAGVYYTIARGTPANPPTLCRQCATLDAYARNAGQRLRQGAGAGEPRHDLEPTPQEAPAVPDEDLGPA